MSKMFVHITGTGRSGTTIVKNIFHHHPEVRTVRGRELRLIIDPNGLLDFYTTLKKQWTPFTAEVSLKEFRKVFNSIGTSNPLYFYLSIIINNILKIKTSRKLLPQYTGLNASKFIHDYDTLLINLEKDLGVAKYTGTWIGKGFLEASKMHLLPYNAKAIDVAFSNFIQSYINQSLKIGNKILLEDNVLTCLRFNDLLGLYKNQRMVFVMRDPRDIVASFLTQNWTPSDVEQSAIYLKSILDRWKSEKESLPIDVFIEVKNEDLINNSREVCASLCDFFKIDRDGVDTKLINNKSVGRYKDLPIKDQIYLNSFFEEELYEYKYVE
jgi:hypothetical protein